MPSRPLRVLFPKRRPTSNPYVVMLGEALQAHPEVELVDLSHRAALFGDWDVIHLHWPEILVSGRTTARRIAKEAVFAALLTRLRTSKRALVRTYHNVELPSGLTGSQERLLRRAERQTALWIVLNTYSSPPSSAPVRLIPHGHYRQWYSRFERAEAVPGRVGYFGLIRRYKSVDVLVSAVRAARSIDPGLSLSIAGKPSTPDLAAELVRIAAGDPEISFRFDFLSEEELCRHVTAAQLIALTHREMFNSGTALAALSLDRPVLLPRNEVNTELAAEVGERWVQLYDEPLRPEDLLKAMADLPSSGRPDLSARDWDVCGQAHVDAYRAALRAVRE